MHKLVCFMAMADSLESEIVKSWPKTVSYSLVSELNLCWLFIAGKSLHIYDCSSTKAYFLQLRLSHILSWAWISSLFSIFYELFYLQKEDCQSTISIVGRVWVGSTSTVSFCLREHNFHHTYRDAACTKERRQTLLIHNQVRICYENLLPVASRHSTTKNLEVDWSSPSRGPKYQTQQRGELLASYPSHRYWQWIYKNQIQHTTTLGQGHFTTSLRLRKKPRVPLLVIYVHLQPMILLPFAWQCLRSLSNLPEA